MFFGYSPPIFVAGVKVNGMADGSVLSVGPTNAGGLTAYLKAQQWNRLCGDFAYTPTGYATLLDGDLYDQPILTNTPTFAPNTIWG